MAGRTARVDNSWRADNSLVEYGLQTCFIIVDRLAYHHINDSNDQPVH